MSDKLEYPVFDHDQDGHALPDIVPGRLYVEEGSKRVVCSQHGDSCATDGSMTRATYEAPIVMGEGGQPFVDQSKAQHAGDARLFRCTVCGQGTWAVAG